MKLPKDDDSLSDVCDMQLAEEIARHNMPIKIEWEVNEKNSMTIVPEWIIRAMIEFRDKSNFSG